MRHWLRLRSARRRPPERDPDPKAVDSGAGEAPRTPPPVVVPRWVQMVMLPLGLLALWELARASGSILLVLIVAGIVALILAPLVRTLERAMPRGLAITLVYIGFFVLVAAVGFLLANPVASQVTTFEHNIPQISADANRQLANLQTWLDNHGLHVHIQHQGQTALDTLQKYVSKRSSTIVTF